MHRAVSRWCLLLCLAVFGFSPALALDFADYDYGRFSQAVTECDRLAAHGSDPGRVAAGVSSGEMDKPAAITACRAAVAADPENPRLNYQLARALGYSDRGEEAMPYRDAAVAADYPQSTFVVGYLHMLGSTIEQDACRAQKLWVRSARYRRLAALIALPRHVMRGDFAQCGLDISDDDLAAYLDEAARQADEYYISMLVAVLQENLAARRQAAGQ